MSPRTLTLHPPRKLDVETPVAAWDAGGRAAMAEARAHAVPHVRAMLPHNTGHLERSTRGRVTRTPDGYLLVVEPQRRAYPGSPITAREVAVWVEGGTGVHGPEHRPYEPRHAEAFALPGGWVSGTIDGQAAQHPFERAQAAEDAHVIGILIRGAYDAAKRVERAGV